ncbi:S-layer homology domain-containing protein [Paenibacillus flagellatus]|uniref:SLH domain-containing protein n=1 Tax=Paenibacillus flagellatus TaxID=2211139 RepID=A0A2V5KKD1_9BACL|nr:S-layer homology domain-containing protein [Paenibacillus flagellatus]PYI51017.1 hypothetical protein DLM86_27005 [Paenibacillus flagellatus]
MKQRIARLLAAALALTLLLPVVPSVSKAEAETKDAGIAQLSAGSGSSLAVQRDGTAWQWGWDMNGREFTATPASLAPLSDIAAVSSGGQHETALKRDGSVWAWGWNSYGQLGDGTTQNREKPAKVRQLADVAGIAAGGNHTVAVKRDGTVWAWGYNKYGQIGDGTNENAFLPVQVKGLRDVVAVSAKGFHSLALKKDGTVWAWGYNAFGQLGNGTNASSSVPVQVSGLSDVVHISAGRIHSLALKKDGTVWAWGNNRYGQLGDGTTANKSAPVPAAGLSDVTAISGGGDHSVALKKDGTVWAWGSNERGRVGPGTNSIEPLPVALAGIADGAAVTAGESDSAVLKTDGTVWMWGSDYSGVEQILFPQGQASASPDESTSARLSLGRSKEQIVRKWLAYQPSHDGGTYVEFPSAKAPYAAGTLQEGFIADGVRLLNFVRFLAGMPEGVAADDQLLEQAQHQAAVMSAVKKMTFRPVKPDDMDAAFFDKGYKLSSSGLIGSGHRSFAGAVENYVKETGRLSDGAGYRRWALQPRLQKIGFGYAGGYTSLLTRTDASAPEVEYDYVAWPNKGFFPTSFFGGSDPWSISFSPDFYDRKSLPQATVRLLRKSDQKVWEMSASGTGDAGTNRFGVIDNPCDELCSTIVFRPDGIGGSYKDGDEYTVSVTGILDVNGDPASLTYSVRFFNLAEAVRQSPDPALDQPADWAKGEVDAAIAAGLVPDAMRIGYANAITRADFSELAVRLLSVKTGKSIDGLLAERGKRIDRSAFRDTDDRDVLAAYALGIVSGKDGGLFDPYGDITRQEAAVMLSRTAQALGLGEAGAAAASFADDGDVAAWAKAAVLFVASVKDKTNGAAVMGSIGDNAFDPAGRYTRQQAFITIKRLLNAL